MKRIGIYDQEEGSQLRHDPVQRRWVIIASERGKRPIDIDSQPHARNNATCPFCTGNEELTPSPLAVYDGEDGGWQVRVVPNKFPALQMAGDLSRTAEGPFDVVSGIGAHEVIIETPNHDEDLASLSPEQVALVLAAYRDRIIQLREDPRLRYILVFKNSGAAAGASLPHSHSQVMATPITPRTVSMELTSAREHYALKERCIFCDLLNYELEQETRIVASDEHFVTMCPYASRFPYEMHLLPRHHAHDYAAQDDGQLLALAHHLKAVLLRMKQALDSPPFNFMLHTVPVTQKQPTRGHYWQTLEVDWHWHLEILPRISNVAGFEWGTGFYINPTPPEEAARHLRDVKL